MDKEDVRCVSAIYIMEYYSAMRKKKILPFVTTWMGFEDIMLSEINQTTTNAVCCHLHVQSKKAKLIKT